MKDTFCPNKAILDQTKIFESSLNLVKANDQPLYLNPYESLIFQRNFNFCNELSNFDDESNKLNKIQTTDEKEKVSHKDEISKLMKASIILNNKHSHFQEKEQFSPFIQFSSMLSLFDKLNLQWLKDPDNNQTKFKIQNFDCLFSLSFLSNYKSLYNNEFKCQEQFIPMYQFPINSNLCNSNFIEETLKSFDVLKKTEIEHLLLNIHSLMNKTIDEHFQKFRDILPNFHQELDNYVKINNEINFGNQVTIELIQQFFHQRNEFDFNDKVFFLQQLIKGNHNSTLGENTEYYYSLNSDWIKDYFLYLDISAQKDFFCYSYIILLLNSAFSLYLSNIKLILSACLLYCIAYELKSFDNLKHTILVFCSEICYSSRVIAKEYFDVSRSILANINIM